MKRTLPLGQFETYSYDTAGNLQSKTDFNGKTTTFAYDSMRRLLSKTPDASFGQAAITFTYKVTGQRETMTDASGTTVYAYDNRNRLSSKQTPFGALSYTYNNAGSLQTTRSSNANGVSVDYTYDALNRLATVKDNNVTSLNGGVTSYTYDDVGNLQSYQYPNGVTTSYAYNSLNRLTTMTVGTQASSIASYSYTLGAAGNRTAVTELSGRTVTYTYDDLYRLTRESIAGDPHGVNGSVSYGYDPVGNRLSRTSTVIGVPSQNSTYDTNDRLSSETYDNNGNTTGSSSNGYGYDFENHLINLNNGAATYVYDGDGNRVAKTVGNVTTNYLVDTDNPTGYAQVVDELQSGAVVRSFTYGHDLISQRIVGDTLSFYQYDGHGSVRQLTDVTATVTDTYDYDAFGKLIYRSGTTPNDYLYSGEQFDTNLGFYYLRARYLNPESGRFASSDDFEGSIGDPRSLHKYVYANASPVDRTDPSGRASLVETLEVAGLIGAVSGFTIGLIRTGTLTGAAKGAIFGALTGVGIALGVAGIGVGVAYITGGAISATAASAVVGGSLAAYSLGRDTLELLSATSRRDRLAAGVSMLFTVAGVSYGAYKYQTLPNNAPDSFGLPASKAQLGEFYSETLALMRGERVVARQVTIETASTRVRVDLVTETLFGRLRLIESKCGPYADYTDNQLIGYPEILQSGGTIRGLSGEPAGLPAGTKIHPQEVLTDWWE